MKYFNCLPIILLLFFCSCRYRDYSVQINSNAPKYLLSNQNYNQNLSLKVLDSRKNKDFIGFRTPVAIWKFQEAYKDSNYYFGYQNEYSFKVANITNNQDIAQIIGNKLSQGLSKKGVILKKFSQNQIKVEIMELSLVSTMYRNFINSKIRVIASNKFGDLDKVYDKKIVSYRPMYSVLLFGPFYLGSSSGYYDDIINECLDQNLQQIVGDDQIWNFFKNNIN